MTDSLNELPDHHEFSPDFLDKSFTLLATEILSALSNIAARRAKDEDEFDKILFTYVRRFGVWLSDVGPENLDKHDRLVAPLSMKIDDEIVASGVEI